MSANRTTPYAAKTTHLRQNRQNFLRMTAMVLLGLMLATTISACGKRGEPYRPSEVPSASSTS